MRYIASPGDLKSEDVDEFSESEQIQTRITNEFVVTDPKAIAHQVQIWAKNQNLEFSNQRARPELLQILDRSESRGFKDLSETRGVKQDTEVTQFQAKYQESSIVTDYESRPRRTPKRPEIVDSVSTPASESREQPYRSNLSAIVELTEVTKVSEKHGLPRSSFKSIRGAGFCNSNTKSLPAKYPV